MTSPSTHQDSLIERFDPDYDYEEFKRGENGEWVRYSDHLAALASLKETPTTEAQDSPKVPERPWPRVVLRRLYSEIRSYSVLPPGREQPPESGLREAETFTPVSALLSDEVVEAATRGLWKGYDTMSVGQQRGARQDARTILRAAIEQVEGVDRG